ncbi:lipoprotein-releasing ABC transporter permease subunit [Pelagibacteraceae bacterium]|nr:lipoprotein-releasing ABC transporter permease subunit [Pelagibacteraceae bacterium]
MFNKTERLISLRNLRPKKKEGFLKVISIFSFLGIALGVSILIVVMSVMNGFRVDLTNKILGLNPHLIIKPYDTTIDNNFKSLLKKKYPDSKIKMSYSGEGVAMSKELVKGVMVKGVFKKEINKSDFLINKLVKGSFKNFEKGTVFIGNELAISLGITIGEKINLMSSAFLITPIGSVPKQDSYTVSGIFVTGFYEFDQNLVFLNINDSLSFFNKSSKDLNLNMYLDDPLKADQYKKEIMNLSNDYYIYSWTDLNKSFFNALKVERNVMFIILTLIIIVAAFNIISGLTILIKNKTKEIAILRTMGLSSSSITKSFFLTGFTIGFLATVTGIVVGTLFSFYIEEIRLFISTVFNLEIFPAEIYFLDTMPSEINPMSIGIIFIFSIIITSMASFFPARMVSKMNTINALKYE